MSEVKEINTDLVESMFKAGAHFGYAKSRRHPSTAPYIFGLKNNVEIFDLEKVSLALEKAEEFVKKIASEGKQIFFVTSKCEAVRIVRDAALKIDQPYVAGRFIGGTLTNFEQVQKRVSRLENLREQKEKGLLAKYTKKERLLIDREIAKLEERFGGIVLMKRKPAVIFIIDSAHEDIAVREAVSQHIPIISLSSSDCNISKINYPITANDSSVASISYFVGRISSAYQEAVKKA